MKAIFLVADDRVDGKDDDGDHQQQRLPPGSDHNQQQDGRAGAAPDAQLAEQIVRPRLNPKGRAHAVIDIVKKVSPD
jgi:hypothetical protein